MVGGSATYVDRVAAALSDVRAGDAVTAVARAEGRVQITTASGRMDTHDAVVVATHADQALGLLADPTPQEKEVLGAFRYSRNHTILHRDGSLMPATAAVRSSWNFQVPAEEDDAEVVVTYWMNRLQGLDPEVPLYVTLNATDKIDPALVIAEMDYTHPIFEPASLAAQRRLPEIASANTVYAGAYHGWGFHEDGARSGVAAAAHLGVHW